MKIASLGGVDDVYVRSTSGRVAKIYG